MSQSPLQRSTRRSLPAFAHTPSRLSKATSSTDLVGTARRKSRFVQPDLPEDSAQSSSYVDNSTSTESSSPRSFSTPIRQLSYNDTPTPRHTPIYYSPQATSTPPAGLSKSASIPFDMAASAKAARRVTAERDSGQSSAGTVEGKAQGKKRYIRKKSILQRIAEYPQHLIDTFLLLSPTSMLDLLPDERYAHPIAVGIHTVHFLVTAPLWSKKDDETSILRSTTERRGVGGRWGKWEEEQRGKGFAGGWGVFIFTVLLLLLASANAIYLFSRFRIYDMQLRSAQEPLVSPHASPVKSPHAPSSDPFAMPSDADDNIKPEDTMGKKVARTMWKIIVSLFKGAYAAILSMLGRPSDTPLAGYTAEDRIQALRVWDPPDFCLAFFCAYPPTSPLQTHLLTPLHPLLTPLLHLTSALLLSYLSQHFRQLVKDRMVFSAEVMREYDRRFVYKRVFASRVDRSVQTEQAETVW